MISKIYTVNATGTAITAEDGNYIQVPFGSAIRRKNRGIMLDGGGLVGYGTGYFDISGNLTFVPEAVGAVSVQLYQDGVAIPGALATVYAATASQPITIPFTGMCRNVGNCCGSTTTILTLGVNASGTVQNLAVVATKVD